MSDAERAVQNLRAEIQQEVWDAFLTYSISMCLRNTVEIMAAHDEVSYPQAMSHILETFKDHVMEMVLESNSRMPDIPHLDEEEQEQFKQSIAEQYEFVINDLIYNRLGPTLTTPTSDMMKAETETKH